jgi:hypothetical protein
MSRTASDTVGLEHEIGASGVLAVRLRAGDARLRAVDGPVVRVHDADGDLERRVRVERGDGSLSLRVRNRGDVGDDMGHGSRTAELLIDVPRGATVVVETASAEVTVEGLTGDQRYRTTSGDLSLRDVSGRLVVDSVSGDIDILAVDTSSIGARTVSGDLSVRAADLEMFRATTTSGDVRLAGRLTGAGPFALDTVSGDMLLALAGDVRLEASTVAGDVTGGSRARIEGKPGRRVLIVGAGRPTMTARSMSGDVSLTEPTAVTRPDAAQAPTHTPTPKEAPMPPRPPMPPAFAADPGIGDSPTIVVGSADADRDANDDARLDILRALERGEIDVAEAGRRLEALDGDPSDA